MFGQKTYEIRFEMGPYCSVGAHIKTGRSPMAQDHFQTPPDPKRGHKNTKMTQKTGWGRAGVIWFFSDLLAFYLSFRGEEAFRNYPDTSEVGGLSSTGKSFRVVHACARCACLVSSG